MDLEELKFQRQAIEKIQMANVINNLEHSLTLEYTPIYELMPKTKNIEG